MPAAFGICFVLEHLAARLSRAPRCRFRRRARTFTMNGSRQARATRRSSRGSPSGSASKRAGLPRPRRSGRIETGGLRLGNAWRTAMTAGHAMVKTSPCSPRGAEGRGRRARSRRRRHRNTRTARLQRGRHRPPHVAVRRRGARQGDEEKGEITEDLDTRCGHRDAADVSQRLPHHRGRGRSADRASDARVLFGDGRQRNILDHTIIAGLGVRLVAMGAKPSNAGADGV